MLDPSYMNMNSVRANNLGLKYHYVKIQGLENFSQ